MISSICLSGCLVIYGCLDDLFVFDDFVYVYFCFFFCFVSLSKGIYFVYWGSEFIGSLVIFFFNVGDYIVIFDYLIW